MAEIVVGTCSEVLSTLHLVHVGELSKAVKSTKRINVLPAPSVCSHCHYRWDNDTVGLLCPLLLLNKAHGLS